MTRPGLDDSTITSSESSSASSTSWVTSRTVRGPGREREQPALHLGPRDGVERAERLVEEQDALARHQRAKERDTLAHAAGELLRHRVGELGKPESVEEGARLPAGLLARVAAIGEGERGVVQRGAPGQEQVALWHQRAARETLLRQMGPAHGDGSRVRLQKTGDDRQQRRLPAAARTDDARGALSGNGEVDTGEGTVAPKVRRTP